MTTSRGSWKGEGIWGRREEEEEEEVELMWVGGGWWYQGIAVTVRLRLNCY